MGEQNLSYADLNINLAKEVTELEGQIGQMVYHNHLLLTAMRKVFHSKEVSDNLKFEIGTVLKLVGGERNEKVSSPWEDLDCSL